MLRTFGQAFRELKMAERNAGRGRIEKKKKNMASIQQSFYFLIASALCTIFP